MKELKELVTILKRRHIKYDLRLNESGTFVSLFYTTPDGWHHSKGYVISGGLT